MPTLLIVIGMVFVVVGLAWLAGEHLGFGRLPGDFVIERPGLRIYVPLMTSLIVSVVVSVLLWLFSR